MATEAEETPVVDAFTAATVTAFQELSGTEVVYREPAIASSIPPSADICAAIELRRQTPGLLMCAFPATVLETLTRRYLPPDEALTSDILDDTAGEFANVIAGQAKTMLKGTPFHYTLSTPVVTRGQRVAPNGSVRGVTLNFDCDAGRFCVWVSITAESQS